jgi:radical SAM protein with 4Fe4S-binding SPASM domain
MIPREIIYRIYGDTLAIIMNVKTRRVVLLKDESLLAWKNLSQNHKIEYSEKSTILIQQLIKLGMLKDDISQHRNLQLEDPEDFSTQNIQDVDIGVINLWAFKNHIPISGHFELTGRCNLRCKHCYCLFNTMKDSLNTEQVFSIVDDLKKNGTFGLVLTGGELFCRNDILHILRYLADEKFVLRINTNGTLITEAIVKEMEGFSNIYRIHVSLYGANPEIHDAITNTPGAFDKTMHALKLLKEAGFDLRINCSVMKSNINSFQKIKTEIGDKMGIPVHFDSEIYPKDDGGTENLADCINDEELAVFLQMKSTQVSSPYKQKLCKAGFSFFSICEDGSVYPCLKMKRFYRNPLGNLTVESFENIWQGSATIKKIRDSLDKKLRECDICNLNI